MMMAWKEGDKRGGRLALLLRHNLKLKKNLVDAQYIIGKLT